MFLFLDSLPLFEQQIRDHCNPDKATFDDRCGIKFTFKAEKNESEEQRKGKDLAILDYVTEKCNI